MIWLFTISSMLATASAVRTDHVAEVVLRDLDYDVLGSWPRATILDLDAPPGPCLAEELAREPVAAWPSSAPLDGAPALATESAVGARAIEARSRVF